MPSILPILGGLASSAIGYFGQKKQNQNSQQFSNEQYEKQKQDNLAFWKQQNAYNAPDAQMKRLQQAGLNPNLIYGSGGQTGGTASPISTPDVQSAQFRNPFQDIPQSIGAFADIGIKQAQTKLLESQNTVAVQDGINKAIEGKDKNFSLGQKNEWQTGHLMHSKNK